VLKVVFIFAERWISDRYAGSIVIFCKAFNIRTFIHDENPQRSSGCIGVARKDFYREHIFEFSESLHEVTNCVRFIFLSYTVSTISCVQIVLENGNLHPIKTNGLFKTDIFQIFPWCFLKGPVVIEIAVPNHAKNPLE
jgi:hypothetical protein